MKMPSYALTWPAPALLMRLCHGLLGLQSGSRMELDGIVLTASRPSWRGLASDPRSARLLTALPLLSLALLANAGAQAIPAMKAPPLVSVYGTFTDVKPDFRHWGDEAVYGYSVGGMIQGHHVFGAEVRGSVLRSGGLEHQEYALAGPRASLHFGRISPYISALGGYAHAWKWHDMPRKYIPVPKLDEGFGPQWTICGGLDLHLSHHFALRMGELGYSQIYATNHSLSQLNASTGIVFHIN